MKIKCLTLVLFMCCSCVIFAQNKLFDKFADMDGVTSVYISKSMLQMMPNVKANKMDLGNVMSKLESVQILTSEKAAIAKRMRDETDLFSGNKSYEQLMRIKDGDTRTTFYIQKNGEKIKELIMLVDEKSEFTIIQIVGDLTLNEIKSLTGTMDN